MYVNAEKTKAQAEPAGNANENSHN
jgi:hypothetical protein